MTQKSVMFVANQGAIVVCSAHARETYPKWWRGRGVAFELVFESFTDVDFTGFFTEF